MNNDLSDGEAATANETERTTPAALAAELLAASDAHATPTLVPPAAEDEPPPTVRWTPPPVLIARSRFGSRADDARP
jgi:hypothetical protein